MKKFGGWHGGKTAPSSSRETRSSKKKTIMRPSLNEDIADLSMLNFDEMKDVRASAYPCNELLLALGIYESFYELVTNAGLLDFAMNEVPQYKRLTFIFVQTFKFFDGVNPHVEFCLYDRKRAMSLDDFCRAISVTNLGSTGRIVYPTDLHNLYSKLCHQDTRTA